MMTLATMIQKVKVALHKKDENTAQEKALDQAIKKYRHLFYE